ncbi:hypothetical protein B194_1419 [Serratia plymuthica A30]|nr:hypothetical protein B194_1419 [Serratia plymuthica A30]
MEGYFSDAFLSRFRAAVTILLLFIGFKCRIRCFLSIKSDQATS